MKISAFPKCYVDDICLYRTMSIFDWIEKSKILEADGLEMYDRFFTSLDEAYLKAVSEVIQKAGYEMPMFCCSPDFTNPDIDNRKRAIEYETKMIEVARYLGGPKTACRILSGQRYPNVSKEQGIEWVVDAIEKLLPIARKNDIILVIENHYKDSYWKFPEFAQKKEIFIEILNSIKERQYFGVQYDPSNAIVAGEDPIQLLRVVIDRIKTMHASDRYLENSSNLEEFNKSNGTIGYSSNLKHGVIGQGLNNYDTIFKILSEFGYNGWVSIEDGIHGMDEMIQSINFLKMMRDKYFT